MPDEYYNSIYTGEEIDRRLGLTGEIEGSVFFDANSESLWTVGAISSSSGTNSTSTTRLRTTGYIGAGVKKIAVASGFKYILFGYSSGTYMGTWNGTSFVKSGNWRTTETDLTSLPAYDFRLVMAYIGDGTITTTAALNITFSASTDTTLSVSGAAADAKATGDALSVRPRVTTFSGGTALGDQTANTICRVQAAVTDAPDGVDLSYYPGWLWTYGGANRHQILWFPHNGTFFQRLYRLATTWGWSEWVSGDASIEPTVNAAVESLKSLIIVDQPHDFSNDQLYLAIILATGKWQGQLDSSGRSSLVKIPENCVRVIASNPNSVATVIAFLKGQSYPRSGGTPEFSDNYQSRISIAAGATAEYSVDSDMRFLYVARNSVSGANITPTIVFECVRPEKSNEPLYVAFGASTTIGAVHGYTSAASDVIAYSDKNYPAMVGEALGLRTVNLGQGGTGFLKRGTGYDTQNFMDAIYEGSEYLKDARLVSLVFGYGNDGAAGLPVGAWDDYYPYDEDGYHPAGDSGVDTMLSKGCTLMGALNWCIKWLQEKYPRAQLVLIFGAPSANKDRNVGLEAQAEGAGIAPYKLTVNDPYTNASGLNAKIKEISVELAKLKSAFNIPIFDTFIEDGIPFSWYATYAKDSDGSFSVFSTTGSAATPTWNSHPNVDGYEIWGNYIAGLIVSQYKPNGRR